MRTSTHVPSMDPCFHLTRPLVLLLVLLVSIATACPLLCQCRQPYYVYCTGQRIQDHDLSLLLPDVPKTAILLDLSDNLIRSLPQALLRGLPKLQLLYLQKNQIGHIPPGVFSGHGTLEEMDLSGNSVNEVLNGSFVNLSSLHTIHLNDNYVERIEAGAFSNLSSLKTLNFSSNQLSSLRRTMLSGVVTLEELDFSHNALQLIENGTFRRFPALKKLFLGHNLIERVSTQTFEGLTQLQQLRLDFNKLTTLSSMHWPPFQDSVQDISISNNRLTLVDNNVFSDMLQLRFLDLSHNQISDVQPGAVWNLRLESLKLDHNAFVAIDRTTFDRLDGVRVLDLGFNAIATLGTGTFDGFRDTVSKLDLRDNVLTRLHPGMFRGMLFLQRLNLANNSVKKVDDGSFAGLVRLQFLSLAHNRLREVTTGMLSGLSLRTLHLDCNPLAAFRGFRFEDVPYAIDLHMNATVTSVESTSANIRWPYVEGSQLYWSLSVVCLGGEACAPPTRELYLPSHARSARLSDLTPGREYYVCVKPVFVTDRVQLEQCAHVTTLERVVVETTSPTAQSANLTSGCQSGSRTWEVLVTRFAVTLSVCVLLCAR